MKTFTHTLIFVLLNMPMLSRAQGSMLDFSFGTGGKVTYPVTTNIATNMLLQPDGRVLFGSLSYTGHAIFTLLRYHNNGSLDMGFDADGIVSDSLGGNDYTDYMPLALQTDGKILIGGITGPPTGGNIIIQRLNSDGSTDSTFGTNGKIITDVSGNYEDLRAIEVQADGKIIALGVQVTGGGWTIEYNAPCLARYNSDGTLDSTFGTGGKVVIDAGGGTGIEANDLIVQSTGKIIVCGNMVSGSMSSGQQIVFRLNANGILDESFGTSGFTGGYWVYYAKGAHLECLPDDKFYMVGYGTNIATEKVEFQAIKYLPDGNFDTTFNTNGVYSGAFISGENSYANTCSIQADGKLIVAGTNNSDFMMMRLNTDGSRDSSFGESGYAYADFGTTFMGISDDKAFSSAIQPDGKIILAGTRTELMCMARFNANAVGIHETTAFDHVKVYPNPFSQVLNIQSGAATTRIKLLDLCGKTVYEQQNAGADVLQVDASGFSNGVYVLEMSDGKNILRSKVIKQQ